MECQQSERGSLEFRVQVEVCGQAEGGTREGNKGPECKPLEDPYQLEVREGKTIPGPASP